MLNIFLLVFLGFVPKKHKNNRKTNKYTHTNLTKQAAAVNEL